MKFDLKKSPLYPALKWESVFKIGRILSNIFLALFILSMALYAGSFFFQSLHTIKNPYLLCLGLFALTQILWIFFSSNLCKNPSVYDLEEIIQGRQSVNAALLLDFNAARAIYRAIKRAGEMPCSNHILYELAKDEELNFLFARAMINKDQLLMALGPEIKKGSTARDFEELIFFALKNAQAQEQREIAAPDLLYASSKLSPVFEKLLVENKLCPEDIQNIGWWWSNIKEEEERQKQFWQYENLLRKGGIGRAWASGYTLTLNKYSLDWTEELRSFGRVKIVGREKEIKQAERALSRGDNVLLTGMIGVGRKTIIRSLVQKINHGKSSPELNYKRVVELNLAQLISQLENRSQINYILDCIFREASSAGNVVLVINDLPDFLASPEDGGFMNLSAVLSKFFTSQSVRTIGTTDHTSFYQKIEPKPAFANLFEKIEVKELSRRETILALENSVPFFENKYKKFISYPALRDIVEYGEKYLSKPAFPLRAVQLLEDSLSYISEEKREDVLLPKHIAKVVTEKTEIPVGELAQKEKEILLNLEALIHKRIINQNEAVEEVSEALRRARSDISIRKGPIGAFLFMGPTGVGKTETAKALTQIYFGNESRMIRLDMSEYQSKEDIKRLIGDSVFEGVLSTKARDIPFALLLLDELEKAHPGILNLFLQIIDEGYFTDGKGRRVGLENMIIIATSNAGYKIILKALKEKTPHAELREKMLEYIFEKGIFRPEFINRFDAMVIFNALGRENLLDIAGLMLNGLKQNLKKKYIDFEITEALKKQIVELSYDPTFGAREMRRIIQDRVENVLAQALLSGEIEKGDKIKLTPEFQIVKL